MVATDVFTRLERNRNEREAAKPTCLRDEVIRCTHSTGHARKAKPTLPFSPSCPVFIVMTASLGACFKSSRPLRYRWKVVHVVPATRLEKAKHTLSSPEAEGRFYDWMIYATALYCGLESGQHRRLKADNHTRCPFIVVKVDTSYA